MCGRSASQPSSWQMEIPRWLRCIQWKPSSRSHGESTRGRSYHTAGGCPHRDNHTLVSIMWSRTMASWKIPAVLLDKLIYFLLWLEIWIKCKLSICGLIHVFFVAIAFPCFQSERQHLLNNQCLKSSSSSKNVAVFGLKINAVIHSVKIFTAGDSVCLMIIWELSGYTRLTFCYQHNRAIISQLGRDMPFWLQFALVISSIHIEMRLSPPPHHNVISSPPSQRRNMDSLCGRNYGANAAFHQRQIQPEFKNNYKSKDG